MREQRENLPNRVDHMISRVSHCALFLNVEQTDPALPSSPRQKCRLPAKGLSRATKVFILLSAATPLLAAGSVLPQPSAAVYADTETTTNIPLVVDFNRYDRLHLTIELDASPTDSIQVAIGTDADGDGKLSMDEEALAFGYDCGTWFERDAAADSFESETAALSGRFRREVKLKKRKIDPSWDLIKVIRRGYGELNESAVVEEKVARFFFGVR